MSAEEHYAEGIRASIDRWILHDPSFAVDPAVRDAYVASMLPLKAGNDGFEQIAWQYWISSFMSSNHYETFANWRRTGRPTLIPVNYPNNISIRD